MNSTHARTDGRRPNLRHGWRGRLLSATALMAGAVAFAAGAPLAASATAPSAHIDGFYQTGKMSDVPGRAFRLAVADDGSGYAVTEFVPDDDGAISAWGAGFSGTTRVGGGQLVDAVSVAASASAVFVSQHDDDVQVSSDSGATWARIAASTGHFDSPAQLDASNSGTVAVINDGNPTVSVSTDGGQTWSAYAAPTGGAAIDVSVAEDGTVYVLQSLATGEVAVYASSDAGVSWAKLTVPATGTAEVPDQISVDGSGSLYLFSHGGRLWYQRDGVWHQTAGFGGVTGFDVTADGAIYAASGNNTVTRYRGLPGEPAWLTATSSTPGQVELTWAPPAINGGSTITGYEINYYAFNDDGTGHNDSYPSGTKEVPAATHKLTISGLHEGGNYHIEVEAETERGSSPDATAEIVVVASAAPTPSPTAAPTVAPAPNQGDGGASGHSGTAGHSGVHSLSSTGFPALGWLALAALLVGLGIAVLLISRGSGRRARGVVGGASALLLLAAVLVPLGSLSGASASAAEIAAAAPAPSPAPTPASGPVILTSIANADNPNILALKDATGETGMELHADVPITPTDGESKSLADMTKNVMIQASRSNLCLDYDYLKGPKNSSPDGHGDGFDICTNNISSKSPSGKQQASQRFVLSPETQDGSVTDNGQPYYIRYAGITGDPAESSLCLSLDDSSVDKHPLSLKQCTDDFTMRWYFTNPSNPFVPAPDVNSDVGNLALAQALHRCYGDDSGTGSGSSCPWTETGDSGSKPPVAISMCAESGSSTPTDNASDSPISITATSSSSSTIEDSGGIAATIGTGASTSAGENLVVESASLAVSVWGSVTTKLAWSDSTTTTASLSETVAIPPQSVGFWGRVIEARHTTGTINLDATTSIPWTASTVMNVPVDGGIHTAWITRDLGAGGDCTDAPAPLIDSAPAITGKTEVGQTLVASPGGWLPAQPSVDRGYVYTYRWIRIDPTRTDPATGQPVRSYLPNGTSEKYTLTADDTGYQMAVRVSAYFPGEGALPAMIAGTATSVQTSKVTESLVQIQNTQRPTMATTAGTVRNQVFALCNVTADDLGLWTPDNLTLAYSFNWLADGQPIDENAFGRDFVPPESLVGKELQVAVTVSANGYEPATAVSTPIPIQAQDAPGNCNGL